MRNFILLLAICLTYSAAIGQETTKKHSNNFPNGSVKGRTLVDFNYELTVSNAAYNDLVNATSLNNGEVWDDPEYIVPVDFPFTINGEPVSELQFGGVGALLFSETDAEEVYSYLFPFESDLIDRGALIEESMSPLSYITEGQEGNRILKIEWNNAGSFNEFYNGSQQMFINFQLWLYEGTNTVEFRFGENFINQPEIFFDGGIYMGLATVDDIEQEIIDGHFLHGDIAAPELSAADITIEGVPEPGTVYTLSLATLLDITVTGENSTSFCVPNGSATAVAEEGMAPFLYAWSNGGSTATITDLDAGTYVVTVTDGNGDTGVGSIEITSVDPISLNLSATSETGPDANDGSATSMPEGGSGGYSYLWSNGETTATISNLPPGVYSLTVTDSEGCTASGDVIVNAFECLSLEVVAIITDARCFGACDGIIEITDVTGGVAPFTYSWNNGSNTAILSDLCPGTYSVTIVDGQACEVVESFLVGEAEEFFVNAGATSESGQDQNDGTAWAAPSGNFGPFTYLWNTMDTDSLITGLAPGIYTVTVTDMNGCTAVESVEVYEFFCIGEVNFNIQPISCAGACDGIIEAFVNFGGIGPFSYEWNTGETTSEIVDLCPGEYDVTITDQGQGCELYGEALLFEPTPLTIIIDEIVHVTDSTRGSITISVFGGTAPFSYLWTGPNGYTSMNQNLSNLDPGVYILEVTDANGCTAEISVEILNQTVSTYNLHEMEVSIFPNPVKETVFISLTDRPDDFIVQLIHINGRVLESWQATDQIDVSQYPPGLYFLKGSAGGKYFIHRLNIIR